MLLLHYGKSWRRGAFVCDKWEGVQRQRTRLEIKEEWFPVSAVGMELTLGERIFKVSYRLGCL